MIATRDPCRIAAGWYKAGGQLALAWWNLRGAEAVKRWERIVPAGCRFRVRPPDPYGPRDAWHTVASHGAAAACVPEFG